MWRLIVILAVLLVSGLPALAQDSDEGTISRQVINGTAGGGSVAGVEVVLITYSNDAIAATRITRSDGEGKFRFENAGVEYEYLVSAKYMEVDYYYPVVFAPGEITAYVEVGVCDATGSDQAIRIGRAHTIIKVEEASLKVTEIFWLVNDGDRTYVGTDGVLVFTLPGGAVDFAAPQELMPDYRLRDDNRVAYLVPFPPGERQLVYSYRLAKPDSNELTLPLEIDYRTDNLEVMVAGEDVEVSVTQLAPAEPVFTTTNERFIHFRGENILRGTVINISLANLSEGGGVLFAILGVVSALLAAGMAAYLVQRRRSRDSNE